MINKTENGNKICGRLCIELEGYLASPLSIGSGEQEETDADVILDRKGTPFIPGSALAGALRAYTERICDRKEADQLFGAPKNGSPGAENDRQSRIFVYDTTIEKAQLGIRNGVRLGEAKTPEFKSKYEHQIIERNAAFKIRIEVIAREALKGKGGIHKLWNDDLQMLWKWVHGFSSGELRLGARSRRGFGRLEIEKARIKKFHMEEKESYLKWLDWDWDKSDAFCKAECIEIGQNIDEKNAAGKNKDGKAEETSGCNRCIEVPLNIPYTLLIRSYSTTFAKTKELPDYEQLTVGGKGEQAVIPGSSIAGAFRSHIAKTIKDIVGLKSWEEAQRMLEPFFGTWIKNDEKKKDKAAENEKSKKLRSSRIIFEETVVNGGHGIPVYRNAIDRFTGGTVDRALYKAVPWAEGSILLRILWTKERGDQIDEYSDSVICGMLLWAILDLQEGILPIGGETAVGRGIFSSPEKKSKEIRLDGIPLDDQEKEQCMEKAAEWARGISNGNTNG